MPTIRIDNEVYNLLKSIAIPFEDSSNSVLRQVAGLESRSSHLTGSGPDLGTIKMEKESKVQITGKFLAQMHNLRVHHALYHWERTFYENLNRFPGALCDPNGCVIFTTENDYYKCSHLRITKKTNVPFGIARIPGYQRFGSQH